MKIAAVIAEYNPFHNGHLYQLNTIRETLGVDRIIVVMSGNFTQRGIPAMVDKFDRCNMALENGADVVFELPVYYATGSAEFFAQGAVSLLDKLGVVDILHFGSEEGTIDTLFSCAKVLANEPDNFKQSLQSALREGLSFPSAQAKALSEELAKTHITSNQDDLSQTIALPNNTLGIEYIKALLQRKSAITPATLKREGNQYHELTLSDEQLASANAIRSFLYELSSSSSQNTVTSCLSATEQNKKCKLSSLHSKNLQSKFFINYHDVTAISSHTKEADFVSLQNQLPSSVYDFLVDKSSHEFLFSDDFSTVLYYKLLSKLQSGKGLKSYYDVTGPISDVITKNLSGFTTLSDFCLSCKSKNLTYNRIHRCLTHILLDLKQEQISEYKATDYASYARLLGFTEQGKDVLKAIKEHSSIPVITKLPKALKDLTNPVVLSSLKADIHASQLYYMIRGQKYGHVAKNEYRKEIVKR